MRAWTLIGLLVWSLSAFADGFAAYQRGDYATALREFRALAEQGDAAAQYNLGYMYAHGQGVPQDAAAAVEWFRLAAGQGDADAQLNLGVAFGQGQGVPQNYAEAVKWLRLSAEQGNADAQSNLGSMYAMGLGVPQDDVEAYAWMNVAAANGNVAAKEKRDIVHGKMTPAQLEAGQKLSRELWEKYGNK